MSLPDYLLEDDEGDLCLDCGENLATIGDVCESCWRDITDRDADDEISEGKRHAKI